MIIEKEKEIIHEGRILESRRRGKLRGKQDIVV